MWTIAHAAATQGVCLYNQSYLHTFMYFHTCTTIANTVRINCENVKESNSVDPNEWPVYLAVLVALFVIFRIFAAMLLTQKAKRFY